MATATSFTFFGTKTTAGTGVLFTGFPFNPDKVDVSVYDYWSTLGGVNKSAPTASAEAKTLSLVNAGKLYWNLYSVTVTYDYTGQPGDDPSDIGTLTMNVEPPYLIQGDPEPSDRQTGFAPDAEWLTFGAGPNSQSFIEIKWTSTEIVKMYNGDTSNEDNFVGYGMGSDFSLFDGNVDIGSSGGGISFKTREDPEDGEIFLCSYGNSREAVNPFTGDYGYVTISGISFLCGAGPTGVASSASNASGSINSLDFYTY